MKIQIFILSASLRSVTEDVTFKDSNLKNQSISSSCDQNDTNIVCRYFLW